MKATTFEYMANEKPMKTTSLMQIVPHKGSMK